MLIRRPLFANSTNLKYLLAHKGTTEYNPSNINMKEKHRLIAMQNNKTQKLQMMQNYANE